MTQWVTHIVYTVVLCGMGEPACIYRSVLRCMSSSVIPWYTRVSFHTGFRVPFRVLVRSLLDWGKRGEGEGGDRGRYRVGDKGR